jgi:hypothetical protein
VRYDVFIPVNIKNTVLCFRNLWNVCKLLPDYVVLHSKRQKYSKSYVHQQLLSNKADIVSQTCYCLTAASLQNMSKTETGRSRINNIVGEMYVQCNTASYHLVHCAVSLFIAVHNSAHVTEWYHSYQVLLLICLQTSLLIRLLWFLLTYIYQKHITSNFHPIEMFCIYYRICRYIRNLSAY